jgi:hypothetical protein
MQPAGWRSVKTAGGLGAIKAALISGGTAFNLWSNGSNANLTNTQLSGQTINVNITYPVV